VTGVSAFACLVAAWLLWPTTGSAARRLGAGHARGQRDQDRPHLSRLLLLGAMAAVTLVAATVVLGSTGLVVVAMAVGCALWLRLRPRLQPDVDVTLAVDLLAGCLVAGAPMVQALRAAAVAAPEPACRQLAAIAGAIADGMAPVEAWAGVDGIVTLAPVARVCTRGLGSGAAVAAELRTIAARERRRRRARRHQRINRAAVWVVIPLGLCFLPAFVLVGVVPLVVGLLPSLQ
jgi:hypothetical protein